VVGRASRRAAFRDKSSSAKSFVNSGKAQANFHSIFLILRPLHLTGLRRGLARILEKQNRLQMGQVFFPYPYIKLIIRWFCF
jgi:hypothetical protein